MAVHQQRRPTARAVARLLLVLGVSAVLAACASGRPAAHAHARAHPEHAVAGQGPTGGPADTGTPGAAAGTDARQAGGSGSPLAAPARLVPFDGHALGGEGTWKAAGRPVHGVRAVYETTLVPPGGSRPARISWMDTRLLSARLYSGSGSPGGGPYRFTAPIEPAQAASLVAAFNGGFKMKDARGGYFTEGRTIDPLRRGAASLVIYANGSVNIGAWGSDMVMTPRVVSVRQNLGPLVVAGRPTPQAAGTHWKGWGSTCGATSCAASVPGLEHQWRSGAGVTADGALVYVTGPALAPEQLAQLLVRAGVVRGMQLDINPDWTVFVAYDPLAPGGLAAPADGTKLLASTVQGPQTFFEPGWARDFVTMSARH